MHAMHMHRVSSLLGSTYSGSIDDVMDVQRQSCMSLVHGVDPGVVQSMRHMDCSTPQGLLFWLLLNVTSTFDHFEDALI